MVFEKGCWLMIIHTVTDPNGEIIRYHINRANTCPVAAGECVASSQPLADLLQAPVTADLLPPSSDETLRGRLLALQRQRVGERPLLVPGLGHSLAAELWPKE